MKIELRYPVVCRAQTDEVVVLLKGEFEVEGPSEELFPMEIDFADEDDGYRRRFRHLESENRLFRESITLSRIRKVEAAMADDRKMPPTFAQLHPFAERFTEARTRTDGGHRRTCVLEEDFPGPAVSREAVRQAHTAAQKSLEGLILAGDSLWRPSEEPYLHVVKGRPKWRVFVSTDQRPHFGLNEHIFAMTEFSQVQSFLETKASEGEVVSNPALELSGRYEYRTNSIARSVMAVVRGVVGYYGNVTSDSMRHGDQYRLSEHSVELLETYLTLRKLLERDQDDLSDAELSAAFAACDTMRTEGKRLGIKMLWQQNVLEQQRERFLERPVHLDLPAAGWRPRQP